MNKRRQVPLVNHPDEAHRPYPIRHREYGSLKALAMMRCLPCVVRLCFILSFPIGTSSADDTGKDVRSKNFAVAPIVASDPNIGSGLGAMVMVLFDLGERPEGVPLPRIRDTGRDRGLL